MNKPIRKAVINTFGRVGLNNYQELLDRDNEKVVAENQFGYGTVETTPLVAECIKLVYRIGRDYNYGDYSVRVDDFDRLRYFVLEQDSKAYRVCLD
jgi:hypothetical protein